MENKTNNDLFSEMGYTDADGNEITKEQQQGLEDQTEKAEKAKIEKFIADQENCSNNYVLGFIGSLVGALIGAIPWGIAGATGYFVAWLGFLIAILSSKGYDLCKVKTTKIKAVFVIVTSVIAVFVGQVIGDIIYLYFSPDYSPYFSENLNYYMSHLGEMLEANGENIGIGIFFVFLGGCSVIVDIFKKNKLIKTYKKEG